ncbi:MAG: ABC transporter permease [Clostridiales Family XIII bacterium]|jgi:NitT/TauT family transport system permease protein|nr:ABC transporter permease [Clostridiales Family XIII bacterium]
MGIGMKTAKQIKKPNLGFFVSLVAIIAFFLLWEWASRSGAVDSQFVPPVSKVLGDAWALLLNGTLPIHILSSLARLFAGLGLAIALGIPLGFLLGGWAPKLAGFIRPLLMNLSMLNPFALIPVFMLLLGIGEASKVGIIFWVLIWPILFATASGVMQIDPAVVSIARSMGAGGIKIFFDIIVPGTINRVFTGLKSALTLGFIVLLSAEMVGAKSGLGWLVFNSNKNYNITRLYVGILFVAVIGFLLSVGIDKLQKNIVVWEE